MSLQMHLNDIDQLFTQVFNKKQTEPLDPLHSKWIGKLGHGRVSYEYLPDGLFATQEYYFHQDVTAYSHNNNISCCFLMCTIEGDNCFGLSNKRDLHHFRHSMITLGYSKTEEEYRIDFKKTSNTRQYSFCFSKEKLLSYIDEFHNDQLAKKVIKADVFEIFERIPMTYTHRMMLEKLVNNPYHGSLKKLYFETHANLFLLSIFTDLSTFYHTSFTICEEDKQRLQKAKTLLLKDIQNPPTIDELAKMVSINQDKLKKGFKALFGNTIFKTLTEVRMQLAYEHLKKREMSVSEIAFEAGYENVSNFIAVFKKTYGQTPGQMRKERSFYHS
ncbi:MAG: AraC family transcriptional regulator [Epsilonproteobacteria bacterium]|nr:AraC family transcriptional regulator [Campylobacterota bacterium]